MRNDLDHETRRLMYKYQYIFLFIQKYFTAITKQNKKRYFQYLQSFFLKWKELTILQPAIATDQLLLLNSSLSHAVQILNSLLKQRARTQLQRSFRKLHLSYVHRTCESRKDDVRAAAETIHQLELQDMNTELISLQNKHTATEATILQLKEREDESRNQIKLLKSNSRRSSLTLDVNRCIETQQRIQELRADNAKLREKMHKLERNVCSFLGEMRKMILTAEPEIEKQSIRPDSKRGKRSVSSMNSNMKITKRG